jgi:hypothetical protein
LLVLAVAAVFMLPQALMEMLLMELIQFLDERHQTELPLRVVGVEDKTQIMALMGVLVVGQDTSAQVVQETRR